MVTLPQPFTTLLYPPLTCIYTISQDADKYTSVLFDTEDGVLVPCDETRTSTIACFSIPKTACWCPAMSSSSSS